MPALTPKNYKSKTHENVITSLKKYFSDNNIRIPSGESILTETKDMIRKDSPHTEKLLSIIQSAKGGTNGDISYKVTYVGKGLTIKYGHGNDPSSFEAEEEKEAHVDPHQAQPAVTPPAQPATALPSQEPMPAVEKSRAKRPAIALPPPEEKAKDEEKEYLRQLALAYQEKYDDVYAELRRTKESLERAVNINERLVERVQGRKENTESDAISDSFESDDFLSARDTPDPQSVENIEMDVPGFLSVAVEKFRSVFKKKEEAETKDGVALAGKEKAEELKEAISDNVVNKLDIVERQLQDEQASKKQLKIGRNPDIRTKPYDINLNQVLSQLKIKTSYADLVKYDTKLKKPDFKNLRYVDPFL